MALIPDNDQQTIREHFDNHLTGAVEIVLFTERPSPIIIPGQQACEMCEETQQLLEEVVALSDKLSLTVHELAEAKEEAARHGIDRVPAFVLKGAARGSVRYFGIPSGYEFSALIADLVDVSTGETHLSEATQAFLASLTEDVNIKVFGTPSCPYCPAAARMAHQMAIASARVTADVIEATEFPDLAQRYRVRGVPKIVINETTEFVGALPEAQYLAYVQAAVGVDQKSATEDEQGAVN